MEKAKPVTLDIRNTPLDEALLLCFKDQPLQFTIIDADKMVVVEQEGNNTLIYQRSADRCFRKSGGHTGQSAGRYQRAGEGGS